jgi:hypothetical protein
VFLQLAGTHRVDGATDPDPDLDLDRDLNRDLNRGELT